MFDTPGQVEVMAPRIRVRAYELETMPLDNKTQITDQERAELGAWVDRGAPLQ
jgi:uncharacterized membrane protein